MPCWRPGGEEAQGLPFTSIDEPRQPPYTESEAASTIMTFIVKNKTPLVVPPAVRRRAGFKSGEEIEFRASGGVITIVPRPPKANGRHTAVQRRIIDARLAKADRDIKTGRVYGPFDSSEEMAASIEANLKKLRAARRKAKPAR